MKFNEISNHIVSPFVFEFPLFLCCSLMMGVKGVLSRIIQQSLHGTDIGATPILIHISHLLIWFTFLSCFIYICYRFRKKWFRWSIFALFFVLFIIQDFLVQNFNSMISPSYLTLLAETNKNEATEFISQFVISRTSLSTLKRSFTVLLLFIVLELIWRNRIRVISFHKLYSIASPIIIIFLLWGGFLFVSTYAKILKDKEEITENLVPSDPFSRSFYSVIVAHGYGNRIKEAIGINRELPNSISCIEDSLNIVLVIGESYSKWHASLYGYYLDTTPFQTQEQEKGRLFVFRDAVTTSNGTSMAMKNILCCNNLADNESWYERPYLPTIIKKSGYDVAFWDNQRDFAQNSTFTYTLNGFLYSPDIVTLSYSKTNLTSFEYDEDLIFDYNKYFHGNNPLQFTIFHLMGQHFVPKNRYPNNTENNVFSADDIIQDAEYLTLEKKQMIAEYDNATRYNDTVFESIVHLFENDNSIIIYLSDHGDEIYDFRDQIYREQGPLSIGKLKYQYEIPFMIWTSEKYNENHPDIIHQIEDATEKRFSSDNLYHLILHLAGISSPFYKEEYDIIHTDYSYPKRIVDEIFDFDEIMNQQNED